MNTCFYFVKIKKTGKILILNELLFEGMNKDGQ